MTDETFTTFAQKEAATVTSAKWPIPDDPQERYRATRNSHRLCKRCQLIQTANEDQICDSCAEKEPYREFYSNSNQQRTIEYVRWAGEHRTLAVRPIDSQNTIPIPYLSWARTEDGRLSLTLDGRLGIDLPALLSDHDEDSLIEFIANAIAVGAGYASIYYTKRKMPFRG